MLKKHLTITTQLRKSSLNMSDITEATTTETTPKLQHSSFARDLNSISKIDFLKQIIKATLSTTESWQITLQIEHFPGFSPYTRNYNILGSKPRKSQEGNQTASITKESLIERITSDYQLTNSLYSVLLYTCEWYFDSHEMFNILLKQFKIPLPLGLSPAERLSFLTSITSRIQTKILAFVKDWLKIYSYKFKEAPVLKEIFLEMLYLMVTHPDTGKWINPYISQIMDDLDVLKTTSEQKRPKFTSKVTSLPEIFIPFPIVLSYSHLLAKQLCIFDQENFQQICLAELCKKAWTKADKSVLAPNLTYIAEMSTKLSRITSYFILMNKQVSFRVMIYQYLIDLCDQLVVLKNFNSAFAIYLGVMSNAVQRLKHTFEPQVSKTYKDTLQNLNELFSTNNNMENLRKKQGEADVPTIPYLGVYLSDLIFIEELPDYNDEGKKILNINKFQILSEKISRMLNFQESYGFHRVDAIVNYITGLPFISEDQVYNLSDQLLSKDLQSS